MALIRWEPFRDMERLLEDFSPPMGGGALSWDLAVDVYEKGDAIVAEMSLPGVNPQKLDISFENDHQLRIAGVREETKETKDKNYYSREIRRGSFERVVRLPQSVMEDRTEAEYRDGFLRISMPKKVKTVADRIKVKVRGKSSE